MNATKSRKAARLVGLGLAGILLAALAPGCNRPMGNNWLDGEPKDVLQARSGWTANDVLTKIGKPLYVIERRGVRTGWVEMVYPTGSIFVYRLEVKYVLSRSEGTPLPERPQRLVHNPFMSPEDREELREAGQDTFYDKKKGWSGF